MNNKWFALLAGALLAVSLPMLPAGAALHTGKVQNAADGSILMTAGDSAPVTQVLPMQFDLREQGLVTPVKNQGNYGMCWCFSSLSSLEGTLVARDPEIDLSEWAAAYYTYSDLFGFPQAGMTEPRDLLKLGGNGYLLSALLTRWIGPVPEAAYPFGDLTALNPDTTAESLRALAVCHVSEFCFLQYDPAAKDFAAQRDAVKQAVYDGHAVSLNYLNRSSAYTASKDAFYNDGSVTSGGYHAVSVVGWDDAFPASRFKDDPGQDGAWLVKNSWGTGWGENGYFWMSYASTGVVECYYLDQEPVQWHDNMLLYDDFGMWTSFSAEDQDSSIRCANVFTAEEDTYITSVMVCSAAADDYTVSICKELGKSPVSGSRYGTVSGSFDSAGYHTVDLSEPVPVTAGERFSVYAELSGDPGQHLACEAYIRNTVEHPDGTTDVNETMMTEEGLLQSFAAGQSYYSTDGRKWHDMYEEETIDQTFQQGDSTVKAYARVGNICLRALTQKQGTVLFSEYGNVPADTEIALTAVGADEIWYSLNDGEERLYVGPFYIMEDTTVRAAARTGDTYYPEYVQQYSIRKARISSMLETGSGEYLTFRQLDGHTFTAVWTGDTASFQPVTTGQITCDAAEFSSGKITQLDTDRPAVQMTVSGEGMEDSLYVIYLKEDVWGDVDLDGNVNASDAAQVLLYAAAAGADALTPETTPDAAWMERADWDSNSEVNASDAAGILIEAAERGAAS